jgi:hypothetical protein
MQMSLFGYFGFDESGLINVLERVRDTVDTKAILYDMIIYGQTNPDLSVYLKKDSK